MKKGNLSVETSNIFPIIKQFLYSEQEIFLRELISNATDAIRKLQTLADRGEYEEELGDLRIRITINKDNNSISIEDNGIGMTEEEVDKYINEIAFSSAGEFIEKYQKKNDKQAVIGHFGLGFYSSFMVADKVEIQTLSFQKEAKPVKWECTQDTNFKITRGNRKERGTTVILHLSEDSKEYLEESRIEPILEKYCNFMPVEIEFNGKTINDTNPIWLRDPKELTSQEYKDFYQKLFPFSDQPLFWIHLNVDYPFKLTGVLYFPKLKNSVEVQKNKIRLYSNQVFVTEHVEDIVPEFLTLLHGVIDSPDIPLNVSRSALQTDSNVRKISNYIVRKVADRLMDIFKNDRKDFESKWDDIGIFIKYGMLTHEKFAEKANEFCLLNNIEDKFFTIDEYKIKVSEIQTDKENKVVFLYATDTKLQNSYIEAVQNKGYDVLKFLHPIDSHFISYIEQKYENIRVHRVDSETPDRIIDKGDKKESALNKEQEKDVKNAFSKVAGEGFNVQTEALSPEDPPAIITEQEFQRRMQEMSRMSGMESMANMPSSYNLIINTNHPLANRISLIPVEKDKERIARHVLDLAKLSRNMLTGKELTEFIRRSGEMIAKN